MSENLKNDTGYPVLGGNKENCCGCGACYSICPAGAIRMTEDEEGFLYPEIDHNKCVKCFRCLDVCAFKKDQSEKDIPADSTDHEKSRTEPLVYAVKYKDDSERLASQSGGAFALLSEQILKQGGVVYGCVFDDRSEAVHARAEDPEGRDKMRYSKYVQSRMGDTCKNILDDLEKGRTVLFSGTPCQAAGVISFISGFPGKIKGKLYLADIVCFGVPSPLVWRDYLAWECEKKHSAIRSVVCRNKKKYGWKSHVTIIEFENGRKTASRVFPGIFHGYLALRPCCYKCPYKNTSHPADITIGDYWGIERSHPEFRDEKGVSLVLVNSAEGEELFRSCAADMISLQTGVEDCLQTALVRPFDRPAGREQFWQDYRNMSFIEIARKYGNYNPARDIRWKLKYWLKKNGLMKH